jgi:hypothetical protein
VGQLETAVEEAIEKGNFAVGVADIEQKREPAVVVPVETLAEEHVEAQACQALGVCRYDVRFYVVAFAPVHFLVGTEIEHSVVFAPETVSVVPQRFVTLQAALALLLDHPFHVDTKANIALAYCGAGVLVACHDFSAASEANEQIAVVEGVDSSPQRHRVLGCKALA